MEGGGDARADDPVRPLGEVCEDLIDHMILETQKFYKGTDMENRCMPLHDALAQ
jgi:hypothetical protein